MKHKLSTMGRVAIALVLALSLCLMTAVPVAAADMAVTAVPEDFTERQETTYTIGFTPVTALVIKSIEMKFADGFNVTGIDDADLIAVSGIGAGALSSSDHVVTYDLTASELLEGEAITITFSGVTNPTGAATYEVTVTTLDPDSVAIDTGTADVTITPLPKSFLVEVGTVTAGVAFSVTITAKDELLGEGEIEEGYTGDHMIDFAWDGTPDGVPILPGFEVINFVDGEGTSTSSFILTKVKTGVKITATDNELTPVVAGTSDDITINPAVGLASLVIDEAPSSAKAGEAFADDITVTAKDAEGNDKTDYMGMVSWTSSDPTATAGAGLPDAQALVLGTCTFDADDFVLKTAGAQTITATAGGVSKSAAITVTPEAAIEIRVTASPTSIEADGRQSSTITATAYDEFGNVDTNYTESVTFTKSLGTLSDEDGAFGEVTLGVATAILTSEEVGTATIKVKPISGTPLLAYVTTTVTLTESLEDVVWVSPPPTGSDGNLGSEASPFETIQHGIDQVAVGGTVNVMPGTYDLGAATLEFIGKAGITVQSTGGAAVTIIDGSGVTGIAISLHASDVTFDGFTVAMADALADGIVIWYGYEGVKAQNNIITGAGWSGIALTYDTSPGTLVVDSATVLNNTISGCVTGIDVGGCLKDSMISNNTITGCTADGRGINFAGGTEANPTQGNTITENTIDANASMGIYVKNNSSWVGTLVFDDNLIEKNTITANAKGGIVIGLLDVDLTITDLSINNNNITGNTGYGIENVTGFEVDAENNWWGTAAESAIEGMIFGYVDYSPWLNAAYPDGESTTTGDLAIVLKSGWNLISLPLIPEDPDIETVLSGLDVNEVAAYSPLQDWKRYDPDPLVPDDLAEMDDGWGYWVDMNTAGTLTVSGYEVCEPQAVPPDYDLAVGWNLIGFKSTTSKLITSYLGTAIAGDSGTLEAIYGYNASTGLYFIPDPNLEPGYGYWLAVNATGTIYP